MAWLRTSKVIHEVERGSNLDLLLRGFNGIGNRFVDALNAIALALSTPQDNSQQVQEVINKIRNVREGLKTAIDNQTKEN